MSKMQNKMLNFFLHFRMKVPSILYQRYEEMCKKQRKTHFFRQKFGSYDENIYFCKRNNNKS